MRTIATLVALAVAATLGAATSARAQGNSQKLVQIVALDECDPDTFNAALGTGGTPGAGLLFRPAKNALIPRIVSEDELVTANSASTVNETVADLLGYPVAGAIVAALAALVSVAFVLDAATYVVSAVLLLLMVVPRDELA